MQRNMSSEEQQEDKGKNTEGRGLLKSLGTSQIPNNHEAKDLCFSRVDNFKLCISANSLLLLCKSYSENRAKRSLFCIALASRVPVGP